MQQLTYIGGKKAFFIKEFGMVGNASLNSLVNLDFLELSIILSLQDLFLKYVRTFSQMEIFNLIVKMDGQQGPDSLISGAAVSY